MDGVLNLLKPPGMTSHDVVGYVRRLAGQKAVGHTGTLDPGAAGVLPVVLGKATKLAEYIAAGDKAYRAEITFGVATDTLDAEGSETERRSCPDLQAARVAAALPALTGPIMQVPPMVSAIKIGGRKLYELARQGEEIEREARPVTIHRFELLAYWPGEFPRALVDVACSKGTYIRSLCVDLGVVLGVPAHMSFLVRTASGRFSLAEALTLEEVAEAARAGRLADRVLPIREAAAGMPSLTVSGEALGRLAHGVAPRFPEGRLAPLLGQTVALVDPGGDLKALAEVDGSPPYLRLKRVF